MGDIKTWRCLPGKKIAHYIAQGYNGPVLLCCTTSHRPGIGSTELTLDDIKLIDNPEAPYCKRCQKKISKWR